NEEIKPVKPRSVERPAVDEPPEAVCREAVKNLDVSEPIFYFGWKQASYADSAEALRKQISLIIMLDALSGPTSDLYEKMNRAGLLNQTYGSEVFAGRSYRALFFGGESKDPRAVFAAFCEMLEEKKRDGLSEEEFAGCKNALYGRALRDIND